jgi:hypothetical protein
MKRVTVTIILIFILVSASWAAKLVSCPAAPSGGSCEVSLVSLSGVTPTTILSNQTMTEISDPGGHGKSDYVYLYSGDLAPADEYRAWCYCSKGSEVYYWMYVWEPYETRVDTTVASRADDSTVAKEATVTQYANYKADVSGLATSAALATAQADLDNPDQYKADVSGLASQASVDALGSPMQAGDYVVPDNAGIGNIWGYVQTVPTDPLLSTDPRLDNLDAPISGISSLGLDDPVEGSYTLRQLLRLISSALFGKASGGGTTTITFRDLGDTKDRIVETVDSHGNRSAVVLNGD